MIFWEILAFKWMVLWHVQQPKHTCRTNAPHHAEKNCSGMAQETGQRSQVAGLPPNSPDLNPSKHLQDVLEQVQYVEAPPRRALWSCLYWG